MKNPTLFYTPSGKFNPLLILSFIVLMPLILVLAFIYTYASLYIPIVGIVTFILLGGFAFITGIMSYFACQIFKVRNLAVALFFALIVGAFALHASWATFVFAFIQRFVEGAEVSFLDVYLSPQGTWAIMQGIYENGWFSIGRSSSSDNVSGIFLGICWVIEALVIVAGPIVGCWAIRNDVFCERCNGWADEEKGLFSFNLPLAMAAVPQIEERGFMGLQDVAPGDPASGGVARLDANVCRTCKNLFALGLTKVEETVNDKGETENKEESLLKGLLVDEEQYKYFRNYGANAVQSQVSYEEAEAGYEQGERRSIAFNPSGNAAAAETVDEGDYYEEEENRF